VRGGRVWELRDLDFTPPPSPQETDLIDQGHGDFSRTCIAIQQLSPVYGSKDVTVFEPKTGVSESLTSQVR